MLTGYSSPPPMYSPIHASSGCRLAVMNTTGAVTDRSVLRRHRRLGMMKQRGLIQSGSRVFLCFAIATGLLLVMFCPASAQTTVGSGSITGLVNDPTGAVVSGARIAITNTATNLAITLTSNSSGAYTSGALTPGQYRVQISAKGFSSVSEVVN